MCRERHHGDASNERIIGLVNVTYLFTSFTVAEIYEDRKIPSNIFVGIISIVRRLRKKSETIVKFFYSWKKSFYQIM